MVIIAIKLNDLSLNDITPLNLLTDKTIQGIIYALDPELNLITHDILATDILARIDELDERTLDILAWQFHADFYDLAATLDMKRNHVKNSLLLHMKKGTVWAIKEALRQLDIEAEYVPWWETNSPPYTFSLRAIVGGEFYRTSGKDALIRNIHRAVEEAKSARSILTELHTEIRDSQSMFLYSATIPFLSGEISIFPKPPEPPQPLSLFADTAAALDGAYTLNPDRECMIFSTHYAGILMSQQFGIEIGVDENTMQELLERFEARIAARLDEQERKITQANAIMIVNVLDRLDEIEKLLQWAGDDEEL